MTHIGWALVINYVVSALSWLLASHAHAQVRYHNHDLPHHEHILRRSRP